VEKYVRWTPGCKEVFLLNLNQFLNPFLGSDLTGSRKSLLNVFQDGMCHPKMAMVIDDRLMVWEDKDQPRVHVVPAFTPYYAPQAEVLYFSFSIFVEKSSFNFISFEILVTFFVVLFV
jgi:hypothetical protein